MKILVALAVAAIVAAATIGIATETSMAHAATLSTMVPLLSLQVRAPAQLPMPKQIIL